MESDKSTRKFMNEDEKDGILRLITDLFLTVGNGYSKAESAIRVSFGKKIKTSTYNNYMSTIMRSTFRAIEDFIAKNCRLTIRPITSMQDKEIRTPMVNCRKWMSPAQIQTLFKFIRLAIKKQTSLITNQEAIDLYSQLNSLIKDLNLKTSILNKKKANIQLQKIHQNTSTNQHQLRDDGISLKEVQVEPHKKQYLQEKCQSQDSLTVQYGNTKSQSNCLQLQNRQQTQRITDIYQTGQQK